MMHLTPETVAAYLDNRLPETEIGGVHDHLADCRECREEIGELHGVLQPQARAVRRYLWLGGLAAAAVVAFVILQSGARTDDRARTLGAVLEPPIYLGVAVRAPARGADSFTRAMALYATGNYGAAAESLHAARAGGVKGTAAPFFLGASLMMLNDPVAAAREFKAVVDHGQSPYLAEAHYYRAKALLRIDDVTNAWSDLDRSIAESDGTFRPFPVSLRDSLRAIRTR